MTDIPTTAPDPIEPVEGTWVMEVSVSPEWFAEQDSSLTPPVQQPPRTVPLEEGYVLIGRDSTTRDVHPLVQADDDTGCSRRHADLSWTGGHWVLRDLNSVNGTYLQRSGAPFPPVQVGGPVPLEPGDAVYVGAWTKLVLRRVH
ncbi:MAG TPA: FHA domain-containing protein [Propionibacteriaceae bacterium]|nr:FHA domain-containing protein [Propionibacteriaceae bacterium]